MDNIFIGRQPIYNRRLETVAYELLHRQSRENVARVSDGNRATSEVLVNSLDFGLDTLVGRRPAFINLTRGFLTGEFPIPFSRRRVVLEVLETVPFDDEVLRGMERLAKQGYTLALDDFCFQEGYEEALRYTRIVKLDVMAMSAEEVKKRVKELRAYPVRLLAEKVQSHQMLEWCMALRFHYFQGHFLSEPNIVAQQGLSSSRAVMLALLAKLEDPNLDTESLEALVIQDPALTLRLLRYINSAFVGISRRVESVRQALVLIGLRTIRKWVSLILLTRIEDKPRELMCLALVRAKMCEVLASSRGEKRTDGYFTVGLFSALAAIMDRPMDEILQPIPLADELKAALVERRGAHGGVLQAVLDYERGAWERLEARGFDSNACRSSYLAAIRWTDESLGAVASGAEEAAPAPQQAKTRKAVSGRSGSGWLAHRARYA